ncbi:unnamed protein product, partial [Rotaria sp. Silwood2]
MKLITLFSAVWLITTGSWAYSNDCAKGPEYWCRDVSTAKDCGAMHHCQKNVWREKGNNKTPITKSETAQMLCNVIVQASNELLTDGLIDADSMKQYLRNDCTKLPDQNNLIHQCEMAVDLYLSDILRHIRSGTEITKICPIIQGHDSQSVFIPKPKPIAITPNQTCVLCEFIMNLLQAVATDNSTAQELANILEEICQAMPAVLKDECKSFIDTYGVDIIALLVRGFNPNKTCELIKLCPKPTNVAFLIKPNPNTCGLCDYVSTYLSAGYPIENVCTAFSTDNNIRQQCEVLVHLYKPNYCSQLPICYEDVVIQPIKEPIETTINSPQCALCKYVVTYIDTIIQNNKSEAAIEAALENVCGILPGPIKDKCIEFVDTYGPILVKLIEKYGTPDLVCNALKLCQNGTQELTPLERIQLMKFKKASLKTMQCVFCKLVINVLDIAIGNNRTPAAIEAALEKVCNYTPPSLRDNCTSFVHKYGKIIAFLLARNATPQQVCNFIKFCNNGTQETTHGRYTTNFFASFNDRSFLSVGSIDEILMNGLTSINSPQCALCKYVVSYIDAVIQNNKSEAAIEAALEKVCNILPGPLKDKCIQFVDTYGPNLVKLIEQYGTPDLVCNALKLCQNGTQELTPPKRIQLMKFEKASLKTMQCVFCKLVINVLDIAIGNNTTPPAIEAALEKVCNYTPPSLRDNCISFVHKYEKIIALLLAGNATPEQVCNLIKFCNNGTQETTHGRYTTNFFASFNDRSFLSVGSIDEILVNGLTSINSPQCALCKYVISYIDNVIQNNKSEAAIEAALEKVCTILPGPIKDKCDQFVITYGPYLVQLIEKYGTPDLVCNALKLCQNGTQEISPTGLIQKLETLGSSIKNAQCSLCKYVISYIDNVIQNNKSEAAIEAALEKVCTILPGPIKDKCDQFVVTYGPYLFKLIETYGTPEAVCDALKLCHNGTNSLQPVPNSFYQSLENNKQTVKISSELSSVINSLECSLCKYVVGYIDTIIQNNKSEAAIEAALEKVCGVLPGPIKDKCVEFVDTYGPILVQLIEKYGTPDQVCNALKLCENGTQLTESISHNVDKSKKHIKNSDECILCKYIISYLNVLIENNATVKDLEKALEVVCVILPAEYHKQCKAFVQTYAPILVELIVELDDPNVVCEWLTLCPKSSNKFIQIPAIKGRKLKSLPCNLCQYLVNYLDAIIQSNSTETKFEEALDRACKVLPSTKLQSDCKLLVHLYGADLIKFLVEFGDPKTVCQAIALTTSLIYAYKEECAIGPEYWCKSFQNAQDCGSLRHCSDTIWRYDEKHTKIDSSTKCEWCAQILENTDKALQNVANNEDLIKSTLLNACKLLPLEDISSKCTTMIENYETIVVLLMKHQRYDRLCHLMDICQNSDTTELDKNIEKPNVDTQSKMLCNVIVRATQELHVNQQKARSEIQTYLKNDCQHLTIPQLVQKCESLIERHGNKIYAHVVSRVELSKICDYIDDVALQSIAPVNCELCTFVFSIAKQMLDTKHSENKVLIYIDEHMCSRLTGIAKKNCTDIVDTNGRDLIANIQDGIQPMLLCTHFQSCLDTIIDKTSPIQKDEMRSFLMNNFCNKLGSLKSACKALMEKDSTRLLQVLTNEMDVHELCYMFGLCQKKSSLINKLDLQDDPSKCKRCIVDFTRRKHIAEKLVNHSSEFLHHLCGQLPQQDDCTKAVDDSINELVTYIRSLDPRTICVQLNMCDPASLENMKTMVIVPSNNDINENIIEYIKSDVCTKLGSLSLLCTQLVDSEGLNLLDLISKSIDPHRVCSITDVCPSSSILKTCHDKCQCCTNKIEIYQRKLLKFVQAIVGSARIMCDHVPDRDICLQLTDAFETNVSKVITNVGSKHVCRLLTLCTSVEEKTNEDQCRTCKNELDIRQYCFRTTINEVTTTLLSLCTDNDCRSHVQSIQQETLDKINSINSQNLCQHLGYCTLVNTLEPSATLLRLKLLAQHQTKTLEERLQSNDVCSEYGQLKPMCEHLLASPQSHRYAYMYMALLKNNPKLIDDDLREQMTSKVNVDVCDSCKNSVQSSKDFLNNALESVFNVLLLTFERCPL